MQVLFKSNFLYHFFLKLLQRRKLRGWVRFSELEFVEAGLLCLVCRIEFAGAGLWRRICLGGLQVCLGGFAWLSLLGRVCRAGFLGMIWWGRSVWAGLLDWA